MLIIPTLSTPSQTLAVQLANQPCAISIRQNSTGLYLSLAVNSVTLVANAICQDANRLVREAYLGFVGDLAFFDTIGSQDPYYTALGSRWVLAYLDPAEVQALTT